MGIGCIRSSSTTLTFLARLCNKFEVYLAMVKPDVYAKAEAKAFSLALQHNLLCCADVNQSVAM